MGSVVDGLKSKLTILWADELWPQDSHPSTKGRNADSQESILASDQQGLIPDAAHQREIGTNLQNLDSSSRGSTTAISPSSEANSTTIMARIHEMEARHLKDHQEMEARLQIAESDRKDMETRLLKKMDDLEDRVKIALSDRKEMEAVIEVMKQQSTSRKAWSVV